jgi:hypothetical protein
MSSDTSNKALATAISAAGLYVLGQTAFRYGARRLGAFLFGGTAIGVAASLFLLYDVLSTAPVLATANAQAHGDGSELEEIRAKLTTCLICQRSASDFSCQSSLSDPSGSNGPAHAFCKACFNVYANQGLLDGGFFELDETSPLGHVSRAGEMPCPMFSQDCRCSSLPSNLLRNNLIPENIELLNNATERIAVQRSLESLIPGGSSRGIRQRVTS